MESKQSQETMGPSIPKELSGHSDPESQETEDERPRVVDKRRFLRLLDEDLRQAEPMAETPRYPSYVEELQDNLRASEERLRQYAEQSREARHQMQSEVDAIRSRLQRSTAEQLEQSKARFIGNLLEILDNLNRAIRSAEASHNSEGLLEGIKSTTTLFARKLEAEGVSAIDPVDEPFDPRFHEAVEIVPVEPERDGLVISVLQLGYKLGEETLIRPAAVSVGQAAGVAPEANGKDSVSA